MAVERSRMSERSDRVLHPSRRQVMRSGLALTAGVTGGGLPLAARALAGEGVEPRLRVGLLTDVHSADKPTNGSRHYRESRRKAKEAIRRFNEAEADFAVELGDLIDQASSVEEELEYLKRIERIYAGFGGPRHYVLGNHCVATLTKQQFLGHTAAESGYYAFEEGGFRFVVLDACFRSDGKPYGEYSFNWKDANIPAEELSWLEKELGRSEAPTVVFVHQRLDLEDDQAHTVNNASEVRTVLEASGNVLAVFQGHNHLNDHNRIGGIDYVTLAAVVEGSGEKHNAYSLMSLYEDRSIGLAGFRQQAAYDPLREG
jgi:alkaline phosphatase